MARLTDIPTEVLQEIVFFAYSTTDWSEQKNLVTRLALVDSGLRDVIAGMLIYYVLLEEEPGWDCFDVDTMAWRAIRGTGTDLSTRMGRGRRYTMYGVTEKVFFGDVNWALVDKACMKEEATAAGK